MGAIIACVILAGRAVAPFGQFATIVARSQQSFAALSNLNSIMKMESERPRWQVVRGAAHHGCKNRVQGGQVSLSRRAQSGAQSV